MSFNRTSMESKHKHLFTILMNGNSLLIEPVWNRNTTKALISTVLSTPF